MKIFRSEYSDLRPLNRICKRLDLSFGRKYQSSKKNKSYSQQNIDFNTEIFLNKDV